MIYTLAILCALYTYCTLHIWLRFSSRKTTLCKYGQDHAQSIDLTHALNVCMGMAGYNYNFFPCFDCNKPTVYMPADCDMQCIAHAVTVYLHNTKKLSLNVMIDFRSSLSGKQIH